MIPVSNQAGFTDLPTDEYFKQLQSGQPIDQPTKMFTINSGVDLVVQTHIQWRYLAISTAADTVKLVDLFELRERDHSASLDAENEYCFTVLQQSYFYASAKIKSLHFSSNDEYLLATTEDGTLFAIEVNDATKVKKFDSLCWNQISTSTLMLSSPDRHLFACFHAPESAQTPQISLHLLLNQATDLMEAAYEDDEVHWTSGLVRWFATHLVLQVDLNQDSILVHKPSERLPLESILNNFLTLHKLTLIKPLTTASDVCCIQVCLNGFTHRKHGVLVVPMVVKGQTLIE